MIFNTFVLSRGIKIMKIISLLLCFLMILPSSIGAVTLIESTNDIEVLQDEIYISKPNIKEEKGYLIVNINESDSYIDDIGKPNLPVIIKKYIFPIDTKIKNVKVIYDNEKIYLAKKIIPFSEPQIQLFSSNNLHELYFDTSIYNSDELYPSEPYVITRGSGINNDQRVLFVNIKFSPQYSPIKEKNLKNY